MNRAICYKEIGLYDEALQLFSIYTDDGNGWLSSKVYITCCYILKGEVERGIKMMGMISDELDIFLVTIIARALFDVGWYKKSREYCDKFIELFKTGVEIRPCHFILDGCCKIMILGGDDSNTLHVLTIIGKLSYEYKDDFLSIMDGQLRFRWFLFINLCLILNCLLYTSPSPRDRG